MSDLSLVLFLCCRQPPFANKVFPAVDYMTLIKNKLAIIIQHRKTAEKMKGFSSEIRLEHRFVLWFNNSVFIKERS